MSQHGLYQLCTWLCFYDYQIKSVMLAAGRGRAGASDNNLLEAEPRVIISIPGPGCPH